MRLRGARSGNQFCAAIALCRLLCDYFVFIIITPHSIAEMACSLSVSVSKLLILLIAFGKMLKYVENDLFSG